jgi:hypothetical protein
MFTLTRYEDGDEFTCKGDFWEKVLIDAKKHGWEPEGTGLINGEGEEVEDWSGAYDTNEGQNVSSFDTENLLEAIGNQRSPSRLKGKKLGVPKRLKEQVEAHNKELDRFVEWCRLDGEAVGFEIF